MINRINRRGSLQAGLPELGRVNLTVEQMRSALCTATENKMHARARRNHDSRRPACSTMFVKMLVAALPSEGNPLIRHDVSVYLAHYLALHQANRVIH
jgi:hypothetical protein